MHNTTPPKEAQPHPIHQNYILQCDQVHKLHAITLECLSTFRAFTFKIAMAVKSILDRNHT